MSVKNSAFYVRTKVEIGNMAEDHCNPAIKVFFLTILILYMYGALCVKYVSGANSFMTALSFVIYRDYNIELTEQYPPPMCMFHK